MTTQAFASLTSPTARAMAAAYEQRQQGNRAGTLTCPKCGGRINFKWLTEIQSTGQCASAGCVRWDQ